MIMKIHYDKYNNENIQNNNNKFLIILHLHCRLARHHLLKSKKIQIHAQTSGNKIH